MTSNQIIAIGLVLSLMPLGLVQLRGAEGPAITPQVLPGNGMAQHDFFYAGESKQRRAFIVIRKGRDNVVITDAMTWHPESAASPLVFDLARVFDG